MDAFDFHEESKKPKNTAELVWNIFTVVVLVSICCVLGVTAAIIANPQGAVRIIPEGMMSSPTSAIPTATATKRVVLPPTWTPGPSDTPEPTQPSQPTQSPFPTYTPSGPATPLPPGSMSYILKADPQLIQDTTRTECTWMGIGGAVFDLRGSPVAGLFMQLGGALSNQPFDTQTTMTGIARQYGEGGYEFTISDRAVASKNTLWIQLMDQAGLPLSDRIYFETSSDCKKNLAFISFKQVK